ncbi:MAG TPA: polysaccharide deacetylase family protein, partial [Chthonomonadales bacterium]|nr:polysaccharide deacetylase family protein [Chthonomonadales bacterium]
MLTVIVAGILLSVPAAGQSPSLAERLGYRATDRLLIINGDDAGMNHSATVATFDSMRNGLMTSATVMVPCPWFPYMARIARENPDLDFGVHITHTSEWERYRWGPVSPRAEVPGLVDPEGYMWRSVQEVHRHATPEQALIEARAQVRRAIAAGIDVTHVDSHMGAMQLDPRFHAAYLELAKEFNLPLRMASQELYERFGQGGIRARAAEMGLVFPDYLIHGYEQRQGETLKDFWLRILRGLRPGVTELYIHASTLSEEVKATAGSWAERVEEHRLFTSDPD